MSGCRDLLIVKKVGISRPWDDAAWKGETARVDRSVETATETTTAYLGGHPGMCESGQGILPRAGRRKGSMFEVYFIAAKDASAE
jgi:hypothetical protein